MSEDKKTMGNTDTNSAKDNVKDIMFFGNGDMFKLLCKAHSDNEQWMKSTKAMYISGVGCVVQVTTQQHGNVAEAVTFVPNVRIAEETDSDGRVIGRKLIADV